MICYENVVIKQQLLIHLLDSKQIQKTTIWNRQMQESGGTCKEILTGIVGQS